MDGVEFTAQTLHGTGIDASNMHGFVDNPLVDEKSLSRDHAIHFYDCFRDLICLH